MLIQPNRMLRLLNKPLLIPLLPRLRVRMPSILLPVDITLTTSSRVKVLLVLASLHGRLGNDFLRFLARCERLVVGDVACAAAAAGGGFAFDALADDGAIYVYAVIGADVARTCVPV